MKKSFITGLIFLLPIAVTFFLISFIFDIFTSPFLDFVTSFVIKYAGSFPFLQDPNVVSFIARIIILVLFCLCILILGFLGTKFFFKSLLSFGNAILMKIPFFKSIYHTTKDLLNSVISIDDRKAFKNPIMVSFPNEKSFCIGFLSGSVPPECEKILNKKLTPVFVPTAPYPISGYLIFAEEAFNIDMTNEEAVTFTVSCGIITPENKEEIKKK
jgi:uncharacterized membrane protein